jgi:hypothetical protein
MRLPAFVWAVILIFLLGAAAVVNGNWVVWTHNFTPLDVPLPATPTTITNEFLTDSEYPYAVQVVVPRKLPFEQLTCSVGIPIKPEVCASYSNVIVAKWKLFIEGKVIASGSSEQRGGAWYGSTDIGREIGRFRGQGRQRYRLEVQFLRDCSILAPTNPHLQVKVPAHYLKDIYVGTGISWMIGELCAAISLILVLVALVIRWIQRSRKVRKPL